MSKSKELLLYWGNFGPLWPHVYPGFPGSWEPPSFRAGVPASQCYNFGDSIAISPIGCEWSALSLLPGATSLGLDEDEKGCQGWPGAS